MKYPPYAIFNLITIGLFVIIGMYVILFDKEKQITIPKNVVKIIMVVLVIQEVDFFIAVADWIRSEMDIISWQTSWLQQIFYIIGENFRALILLASISYLLFRYWRK